MILLRRCIHRGLAGVAVAGCLLTCGGAAASAAGGPPPAAAGKPAAGTYVLDFSASANHGVAGGQFENFAFTLNLREPVKQMAVRYGNVRQPDVVATFDYAGCSKGQEMLLEKPLGGMAPGDPAWVDSVDIEMIPLPQRDIRWAGGVCYGYREPGGVWHWSLATTPLTYDAATDRVRARISVRRGPIDALKLVFDYSVPRQFVRTVTVTTRPPNANHGR